MLGVIEIILICVFAAVYLWVFYNLPVLAAGVRESRRCKQRGKSNYTTDPEVLPTFSVIVPVKDESKVVGRLFASLADLKYPKEKVEVIVVEDGSSDSTLEVCAKFAASYGNMKVLKRSFSDGKPSALNFGLAHSSGDVVAFFDADSVPEPDILLNAVRYFEDPAVAAVQGRTLSLNSGQNMLTQFISYEEGVWSEAYLRGKDSLGLFVHLRGSCQFIRREVLEQLGGFDERALSEDMELSARLTQKGFGIRYGGDVVAWQESPDSLKMLFRQRTRWFRGTMEVAFKYGRLMSKPTRKRLDAELTLVAPFILMASLLSYALGSGAFFAEYPFDLVWHGFVVASILATTLTLLVAGAALVYTSKSKGLRNLLWLPSVFAYWGLQGFIALYAAFLILLRRPKRWEKTEKTGVVTASAVDLSSRKPRQL